jgi:hypothetical protein
LLSTASGKLEGSDSVSLRAGVAFNEIITSQVHFLNSQCYTATSLKTSGEPPEIINSLQSSYTIHETTTTMASPLATLTLPHLPGHKSSVTYPTLHHVAKIAANKSCAARNALYRHVQFLNSIPEGIDHVHQYSFELQLMKMQMQRPITRGTVKRRASLGPFQYVLPIQRSAKIVPS